MNFAGFSMHKVIQVKSHSFYCTINLRSCCNGYKYSLPTSKPMANKLSLDKFEMLTHIYVLSEIRVLYACFSGVYKSQTVQCKSSFLGAFIVKDCLFDQKRQVSCCSLVHFS